MYLNRINLENTGPISKCDVKLPFDGDKPLPVVIVGPNGSGKTIFLSYIVDAFFEFAKKAFSDIVDSDGLGSPYFRIVGGTTVKSGESFSLSFLRFRTNDEDLYYREKAGRLDCSSYSPESDLKLKFAPVWNWPTEGNDKKTAGNQETIKTEMGNGAHAFFPSSRHEDPDWLNPKSLKVGMDASANRRFNNQLDKPLWIEACAEANISWVLDVFLDSLSDLDVQQKVIEFVNTLDKQNLPLPPESLPPELFSLMNSHISTEARKNVEDILKAILQDQNTKLSLNNRNVAPSRISVRMSNGRIIPTLQSLSAGQSQLFHLFVTIIRYGERADLNRSVNLSEITGLVVIDEIDANLHSTLQHDVLPELIKLFPKVQFIVSSHSPLFLLGMEEAFESDGFAIIELPDGNPISCDRFSEFKNAFEYYKSTKLFEKEREQYEEELKQRFAEITKPVVLTEGKTDSQYIQTALEMLGEEELLNSLDIRPVGKEGDEGDAGGGKDGLDNFRKFYALKSSIIHQPILLLYDYDVKKSPKPVEKLSAKLMPHNPENIKVTTGIENLFPKHLFEGRFYDEKVTPKKDGGENIDRKLNKTRFCEWICENGSKEDFAKFDSVVQILQEFFDETQTPPVQQTQPE